MATTTYKITAEGSKGASYAQFEDGLLRMFINEWSKFVEPPRAIPMQEKHFLVMGAPYQITELKPRNVADKVALFCIKFKEYMKFTCRPTKTDKANLTHVTVSEEYLKVYFTTKDVFPLNSNKSMADYIRHYDAIRNLAINGVQTKSNLPNVYDMLYEKQISDDPSKLQRYWAHLRELGWRKIDGVWRSPEYLSQLS
jgi:hypothetical protein